MANPDSAKDVIQKPLKAFLTDAEEASSKASDITRNLGLGAIAIVWIFKNPESTIVHALLPSRLLIWALLFAVFSLSLDLLQYIFRYVSLNKFYNEKEEDFKANRVTLEAISDLETPDYIPTTSLCFWIAKIVTIVLSYGLLSIFIVGRL